MQSVQNLGHQQRSHDAHQDNRHRMRDSASIESKDREKIFTCHGKDRMEHIDWQGVSPNIQNHLKRFAMTKSFERRARTSRLLQFHFGAIKRINKRGTTDRHEGKFLHHGC